MWLILLVQFFFFFVFFMVHVCSWLFCHEYTRALKRQGSASCSPTVKGVHMADTPNAQTGKTAGFDFSPNRITGDDYLTVKAEREEVQKKQLQAANEFMFQHYARLLRELDKSYARATEANITLEKKQRRDEAKKRHETLKGQQARQR
jgi:hypothetical protein